MARSLKYKVGNRVELLPKKGSYGRPEPPAGTKGTVRYLDPNQTIVPYWIEWDIDYPGGNTGEAWANTPELRNSWPGLPILPWGRGSWIEEEYIKPAHRAAPAPKAKPKRPTDFLPGDRVNLVESPDDSDELPVGSIGTVIGVRGQSIVIVSVDWAPWEKGHHMVPELQNFYGYPLGTRLPGDTAWEVEDKNVKIIQRGNIVYED